MVLSGACVLQNPVDPSKPLHRESAIVPNRHARNSIPASFRILGSAPSSYLEKLGGDEGTIYIRFLVNQALHQQSGRTAIFHCSTEGLRQIRIWQTYKNRLRFEVFGPKIGRKTKDYDVNFLTIGDYHGLAIAWGDDGIPAALDGQMLK